MLDWEGGIKAQDDRIRGLENQKKALIEKSDLMQVLCLRVMNLVYKSLYFKDFFLLHCTCRLRSGCLNL